MKGLTMVSTMNGKFILLDRSEIDALISWHRDEQYQCANREEYSDAAWHRDRAKELHDIRERNDHAGIPLIP